MSWVSRIICDTLRDLVPFVKFRKRVQIQYRKNSTNGTISHKASHLLALNLLVSSIAKILVLFRHWKDCNPFIFSLFLHLPLLFHPVKSEIVYLLCDNFRFTFPDKIIHVVSYIIYFIVIFYMRWLSFLNFQQTLMFTLLLILTFIHAFIKSLACIKFESYVFISCFEFGETMLMCRRNFRNIKFLQEYSYQLMSPLVDQKFFQHLINEF